MNARLARHDRIALAASGGKDSLACLYLLKDHLDRITVYHVDTGDVLPEMAEAVAAIEAWVPHFVRVRSDARGWIAANGLPTDLLPHSAHMVGRGRGAGGTPLAARWDCCMANRMAPLVTRIMADGNTMMISGTRRDDMRAMPCHDGDVVDGIEHYLPIETWSADDVLAYLASVGATVPPVYPHLASGVDCAHCPAWWSEQRGAYLRKFHPELYREYQDRLALIAREIGPTLGALLHEMAA